MSKRAKKSAVRARVIRSSKCETLEDRIVMSADPLGSPTLSLHGAIVEDDPALVAPPLTTHGGAADADLLLGAPPLGHHSIGGGLLGNSPVEVEAAYDPNADFWTSLDVDLGLDVTDELGERIEQTLANANSQTGQDQVVSKYGFDGTGQTIAVIDSGIAWSHTALGNGYGSGYKVVGGWDFTENDADPYDDGLAGSHGTHVAGIIGAEDATHSGVATGVDLVGLRVFDDAGNGYFSWVEQALDWVHTNKDAFDNPITAVNLSLGAEWNSHSLPGWAMLEDEFAALEADGIFISVSAGNSFTSYNDDGLGYPAVSDHVIPVMSVDDNGQLSYFSQRANYAIAAPGRGIVSTVPDYAAGDADTIDDDWASFSGTSMAAPYVAGASALVREAMEFVGMTNINQWDIYNHIMSTGDQFFDSITNDTYTRLNLESAIDALMPTDDYGSSQATAHDLGTLQQTSAQQQSVQSQSLQPQATMSGVISTLDDSDYFSFTAGATGTVTITASGLTHSMAADWAMWGASSWNFDGNVCTFDVVAGQEYTVALFTADGLGYYDLSFDLQSAFSSIDLGASTIQQTHNGLSVDGEQWYSVTATQAGLITADALVQAGSATVAFYDSNFTLIDGGTDVRADATVGQGDELYIQVVGVGSAFDLRLTNAVSMSGSHVNIQGTQADDNITFTMDVDHTVSINGVGYVLDGATYSSFTLDAGNGQDDVTLSGSTANDTVIMRQDLVQMISGSTGLGVFNAETVTSHGGGGHDRAYLYDTLGDDSVAVGADSLVLIGSGVVRSSNGFEESYAYSSSGNDSATFIDSASDDILTAMSHQAIMRDAAGTFYSYASGFDAVYAYSIHGGSDTAYFYDSANDDRFVGSDSSAFMRDTGQTYYNYANGFENVFAISSGAGQDEATLNDSAGDDRLTAGDGYAVMRYGAGNKLVQANLFSTVNAISSSGDDWAYLFDSSADDILVSTPSQTVFRQANGDMYNSAVGFRQVFAFASQGDDKAYLQDSAGDDILVASPQAITLRATDNSFYTFASGFGHTETQATTGNDIAFLSDSLGDDVLTASPTNVVLRSVDPGYYNLAAGFSTTYSYASGGNDTAVLYDSAGSDHYIATSSYGSMRSSTGTYANFAMGFESTTAYSVNGGSDFASYYDSQSDEALWASGQVATLYSGSSTNRSSGFDSVTAYGNQGGNDSLDLEAVDYAFEQVGTWA